MFFGLQSLTAVLVGLPPARLINMPDDSDEVCSIRKKASYTNRSLIASSTSQLKKTVPASPVPRLPKDLQSTLPSSASKANRCPNAHSAGEDHQGAEEFREDVGTTSQSAGKKNPPMPQTLNYQMALSLLIIIWRSSSCLTTLVDEVQQQNVIQYLGLIGGETPQEVVRISLGRLMHGELVLQYTLQGSPQKKAFMSLLLHGIMKKVVRHNPVREQAMDKEKDFAIRELFRTASDRNGRRLRRAQREQTTTDNRDE